MAEVCRALQVTEATYYRWHNQFGGLKTDDAKELERENTMLKGFSLKRSWRKRR